MRAAGAGAGPPMLTVFAPERPEQSVAVDAHDRHGLSRSRRGRCVAAAATNADDQGAIRCAQAISRIGQLGAVGREERHGHPNALAGAPKRCPSRTHYTVPDIIRSQGTGRRAGRQPERQQPSLPSPACCEASRAACRSDRCPYDEQCTAAPPGLDHALN